MLELLPLEPLLELPPELLELLLTELELKVHLAQLLELLLVQPLELPLVPAAEGTAGPSTKKKKN